MNEELVGSPLPRLAYRWQIGELLLSGARGPQALFLHDVPQLAQVGLGDDVIGFQVQRSEVIGFCLLQFPIEVENRPQVHQGGRVLKAQEI